jgi:hypothetical protein
MVSMLPSLRSKVMLHAQKPPEVTLTACRCVEFAWRCAASSGVERSRACLAMDARLNEARCVASVGPTVPDSPNVVMREMLIKPALLSYR